MFILKLQTQPFITPNKLPPYKSISSTFPNSTAFRRPTPPTPSPLATHSAISHSSIQ